MRLFQTQSFYGLNVKWKPAGHHKKWLADQIATHTLIPQPNVPVYYKKIHGEIKIISKLIVMTK